jgi:hypothetical protein
VVRVQVGEQSQQVMPLGREGARGCGDGMREEGEERQRTSTARQRARQPAP